MSLASVSLALAVSTAWVAIFLGALPAPALRFYPREMLRILAGWLLVALTAPAPIFHWYLILAFIVLVAWVHVRRDRFLAGKVWLGIAAGLGISIGVVFFLQSSPVLFPVNLPTRDAALLLASLYLGGAVAGAAWAGALLSHGKDVSSRARSYAGLLLVLTSVWLVTVLAELALPLHLAASSPARLALERRLLLVLLALLVVLSALLVPTARRAPPRRATPLFILAAVFAFGAQVFARVLLL